MNICALILEYRQPERTRECVESLTVEGVNSVLIWDNSVDDGRTWRQLESFFQSDSRIRIHGRGLNLGFASGVNEGVALCRRCWPECRILLINNDATVMPGSLAAMNAALDSSQEAAIAYPRINGLGALHYHAATGLIFKRPVPGSFPFATGCCMLLDPGKVRQPLFDTDFFMYGEDVELAFHCRHVSGSVQYVPAADVVHIGSAGSGQCTPFYEKQLVSSSVMLAGKLATNFPERMLYLLLRGVFLVARGAFRSAKFRSMIPLRALFEACLRPMD